MNWLRGDKDTKKHGCVAALPIDLPTSGMPPIQDISCPDGWQVSVIKTASFIRPLRLYSIRSGCWLVTWPEIA